MGRFDHIVAIRVDERLFLLSKCPPQDKDDAFLLVVNHTDDLVRESFPAAIPM